MPKRRVVCKCRREIPHAECSEAAGIFESRRGRVSPIKPMKKAESRTVGSGCIAFSSIPHTTRLFDDFLHDFDKVRRFYARSPLAGNWWQEERERIAYPDDRRKAVAAILERQNRGLGASEETLRNIYRLRDGAPAVVTGQQVGLFGGPVYCLLKAVSLAKLAEETGSVPVFWLASEDHDLDEINSVNLPGAEHLQKFAVNVPHPENAPVGTVVFGDEITAAVKQVEALFGASSEISGLLADCYRKGENFAGAFARLYVNLLGDLGIVFLNPLDVELHRVAQPLYRAALEKSEEINQAMFQRCQELDSAGYHAQVKVTPSHTLCFYLQNGARMPVRQEGEEFLIGDRKLSRSELLAETERCPERFSANVLLRPVIEDYLLPTLCYIGGPSEIAYFAQAETVYRLLSSRVTPIVPRIFATLVEPRQAKLLERYGLTLPEIFVGPEKLREVIAARVLPEGVMKGFDVALEHLEEDMLAVRQALEKLDRTLVDAAENAASKMRYQMQGLRDKAARAESRKNTELQRHAEELSIMLYPNKELQEREIGAAYFLLKYGASLMKTLKQNLKVDCLEHQMILLDAHS
jgi:bacillithiol synthase